MHALRTALGACVAGGAEPDEIRVEDLILHAEEHHADDAPRIVALVHLTYRTTCGACSAGKTLQKILASGRLQHLVTEPACVLIDSYWVSHILIIMNKWYYLSNNKIFDEKTHSNFRQGNFLTEIRPESLDNLTRVAGIARFRMKYF